MSVAIEARSLRKAWGDTIAVDGIGLACLVRENLNRTGNAHAVHQGKQKRLGGGAFARLKDVVVQTEIASE